MCKTTWFLLHTVAFVSLIGTSTYVFLNETGRLDKVKRECYNMTMDIKENIKKKMKP